MGLRFWSLKKIIFSSVVKIFSQIGVTLFQFIVQRDSYFTVCIPQKIGTQLKTANAQLFSSQ